MTLSFSFTKVSNTILIPASEPAVKSKFWGLILSDLDSLRYNGPRFG